MVPCELLTVWVSWAVRSLTACSHGVQLQICRTIAELSSEMNFRFTSISVNWVEPLDGHWSNMVAISVPPES